MKEAHELKLMEVKEEYRRKDEQGIPMSIRERYWNKMDELRERVRNKSHGEKLGQVLVEKRLVSDDQLKEALNEQAQSREDRLIGEVLLEKGVIDEDQLEEALKYQLNKNGEATESPGDERKAERQKPKQTG